MKAEIGAMHYEDGVKGTVVMVYFICLLSKAMVPDSWLNINLVVAIKAFLR